MNARRLVQRNVDVSRSIALFLMLLVLTVSLFVAFGNLGDTLKQNLTTTGFAASAVAFAIWATSATVASYNIALMQLDQLELQTAIQQEQLNVASASLAWAKEHPGGDVHLTLFGGK